MKDPFRLFFPLGAALALIGVAPWTIQVLDNSSYPREFHRVFMINGFLLAFVCGFLMTAVPRFTGSFSASRSEVTTIFLGFLGSAVSVFLFPAWATYAFSACVVASLILFAARRFMKRTSNPPYTFVFIGVGLLFWLLSNMIQAIHLLGVDLPSSVVSVANDLFTNGAIMCLILGVGGRLIPGIFGWQEIVVHQRQKYENTEPFLKVIPWDIRLAVALFVLSFFVSAVPWAISLFVRALVTSYIAFKYWRLHRVPKNKSFLTWSLWVSCWCVVLGYFLPAMWRTGGVHALHLLFVGGFSLLTLLVSTRVSFAHSSVGTDAEKSARGIGIYSSIIVFAMITRVTAILWPKIYFHHLGYAAILWILGLGIWVYTLRRCFAAQ